MTKRARLFFWFSAVLSFVAAGYAENSAIFYAWLTASAPQRWSGERAAPFVYGSLALTIFFLFAFICCVVVLVRDGNRRSRLEENAT
jgi:hypothetical protein